MKHCDQFEDPYSARSVREIEGLRETLKEVETKLPDWTTVYVCEICGTRWVERYEERGHGEIPSVSKLP